MVYYSCKVYKCGGGKCIHKLLDETCPHCGCKMVLVTTTGFKFCSHPDPADTCDYEIEPQPKSKNSGTSRKDRV